MDMRLRRKHDHRTTTTLRNYCPRARASQLVGCARQITAAEPTAHRLHRSELTRKLRTVTASVVHSFVFTNVELAQGVASLCRTRALRPRSLVTRPGHGIVRDEAQTGRRSNYVLSCNASLTASRQRTVIAKQMTHRAPRTAANAHLVLVSASASSRPVERTASRTKRSKERN